MSVAIEELAGVKMFVSIPCYNCEINSNTVMGLMQLASLARAYNVQITMNFLHDSLVTRVRNRMADLFLASDATHHVLIDSDIEFQAADILKLISMKKEFIAAPYPKKQINWKRIKGVVQQNPNIDPASLEKLGGDFVINMVKKPDEGTSQIMIANLNEVTDAGTGFMIIQRSVYEKMISSGEAKGYTPMDDEPSFSGPKIYDFFRADIDADTNNYLSEDYWFCRVWKKIGGQVWVAPWVRLNHWGMYKFTGDLVAIAETCVNL
jgi:hypothetical protein